MHHKAPPLPRLRDHRRRRRLTPLWVLGATALVLCLGATVLRAGTTAAPPVAADPAGAEEAWKRGFEHQKNKRTDAAIVAYEEALALNPNHIKALYEVGWSYWVLGRWADVVRVWDRVLDLEPGHPEVPTYIGEARTKAALKERLEAEPTPAVDTAPRTGPGLRLVFGGDTMMGSELSNSGLPANDGAALLTSFAPSMLDADLAFLNLEGVLLDAGKSHKCKQDSDTCYAFRTPVRYGKNLVAAGVDVVSFANNHVNDYGAAGRSSTLATLDGLGIAAAGPLDRTVILESKGTRVGFLGFATSPLGGDLRDIPLAVTMVEAMDEQADLVVVSFHGGAEGSSKQRVPQGTETFLGENRGDLRAFSRAVIDAGADLVIGHGPHVLRGMEVYGDRLVAYSLGNFVTYGGFNLSGRNGLSVLLQVDVDAEGRFLGGLIHSARQIPPGGPLLDPTHEAAAVIRELSALDFPGHAPTITDDGRISP